MMCGQVLVWMNAHQSDSNGSSEQVMAVLQPRIVDRLWFAYLAMSPQLISLA